MFHSSNKEIAICQVNRRHLNQVVDVFIDSSGITRTCSDHITCMYISSVIHRLQYLCT